ncbi:MAG: CDP-alcohol phosphatidyltransferase family protein [Myxococcota bacterium]
MAAPLVVGFAYLRCTPSQVTLLSLAFFLAAAGVWAGWPTFLGGLVGVILAEISYLLDCADGMLARHTDAASVEGHLFDFFADGLKACLLVASLGVFLWRKGGHGVDLSRWDGGDPRFLLGALLGVVVVSFAVSTTSFLRRPEIAKRATPVEAHHEQTSRPGGVAGGAVAFLQFLNHYPSHFWCFALLERLDMFFWLYILINLLALGRNGVALVRRFAGRAPRG